MKRLESNLTNMVLSLTVVALAAAALLGGLYVVTAEPIAKQKQEKQQAAIISVLPAVEGLTIGEPETLDGMTLYKAFAGDTWEGTAVEVAENGFGGTFKVMVGFDKEGNVVNYEVLEHQETPGLGDHMTSWFKTDKNRQSVIGKSPETTKFVVSKDGGDVDAITAATISSRAFLRAVEKAYAAYKSGEVQAVSGASILQQEAPAAGSGTEADTEGAEQQPINDTQL